MKQDEIERLRERFKEHWQLSLDLNQPSVLRHYHERQALELSGQLVFALPDDEFLPVWMKPIL